MYARNLALLTSRCSLTYSDDRWFDIIIIFKCNQIHIWVIIAIWFHHTLWLAMTWQYWSSCGKELKRKHSAAVLAGFTAHLQKLWISAEKVVVGSAQKSLFKRSHLLPQYQILRFGNQRVKQQKSQVQMIAKFQVMIFPTCLNHHYIFVCNFLKSLIQLFVSKYVFFL